MRTPSPSLEALADVVAPRVLLDAVEASQRLTDLGVPHALIGGLAVGLHGHPRATKDVDFLVGAQAFERTSPILVFRQELREIVRVGVIDIMPPPTTHPELATLLSVPEAGQIPVLPVEPLVLLKLDANRPQDRADVVALLRAGADLASISAWVRR